MSYAESAHHLCVAGVGQDILKGVYYALVLTVRNLVNFIECQKTKQRECPVGVVYQHTLCSVAIGVLIRLWQHWA